MKSRLQDSNHAKTTLEFFVGENVDLPEGTQLFFD
jgi:hypothetical protein